MTAVSRLADQLLLTLDGPMWHGPALLENLKGVTPSQAATRPIPGAHGIWELVLHTAVWAEIAADRLDGRSLGSPAPQDDFPAPPAAVTDDAWRAALARLEASYRTLSQRVAALDASALDRRVETGSPTPYTVEQMLRGVIEHGVYHAGQVALLRKLGA